MFPALAVGALVLTLTAQRRADWGRAFAGSSLFIVGLLTTMAAGLYPYVLPAREHRPFGLTVDNAAAGHDALVNAIVWWPLGMVLAAVYFTYAYRLFFRTATVRSTSAAIDQPPNG